MEGFIHKLTDLRERADYLNQKTNAMVEENRQLKEKVRLLQQNIAEKNQILNELQDQYNILKLAKNIEGGDKTENAEELRKKINKYLREIDQCLKLLGD